MKGRGIKICSIRPDQSMDLWIQSNLTEEMWIAERAIQRSSEDRSEIDLTLQAVTECDSKAMWANNLEIGDAMEGVNHLGTYGSGSIGRGSEPACSRPQSATSSG
jgi:hypothetical protein